jgi:hypothetical protein
MFGGAGYFRAYAREYEEAERGADRVAASIRSA